VKYLKKVGTFVASGAIAGALVLVPTYLAIMLLLKVAGSLRAFVRPLASLLPTWLPAEHILSILLVLFICFLIGMAVRTPVGDSMRDWLEKSVLEKIPGYSVLRSLTRQLADNSDEKAWKPALVELEDALVPAFVIEELEDGQFTVFVPSVPTPLAGAIYILGAERVHRVNVHFTHAVRIVSRWGAGAGELVTAMKAGTRQEHPRVTHEER